MQRRDRVTLRHALRGRRAFAAVNMPADDPGSLTTDEYYAILAFALFANGIELEERLTPEIAEDLEIPR